MKVSFDLLVASSDLPCVGSVSVGALVFARTWKMSVAQKHMKCLAMDKKSRTWSLATLVDVQAAGVLEAAVGFVASIANTPVRTKTESISLLFHQNLGD